MSEALFHTRCPHCRTSFRVSQAQLDAAAGTVRCGACLKTFSAVDNPLDLVDDKRSLRAGLPELKPEDALEAIDPAALDALEEEAISFTSGNPGKRRKTWLLLSANVLLLLLLAGQFVWDRLDAVLAEPRLRPATAFVCGYLPCPAPSLIDLSTLHIDDLSVQSHPSIPNALRVDFIFRNTAGREQLFPLAELNFSDINRRLLANRLFTPEDYLPAELAGMRMMPPNSTVQVRLEILDPGQPAVNYSLALRAP